MVIGLLIVTFVGQRTIVHDISMEPTLHEGDNLIVEKLSIRFNGLHRGDIVVLDSPGENRQLIKRLIAFEGETIKIQDGKVFIDGRQLEENYLTNVITEPREGFPESGSLTIPKGMVFVMGDNRPSSMDSRTFGAVEKTTLRGRAVFRAYPFNKFGKLK